MLTDIIEISALNFCTIYSVPKNVKYFQHFYFISFRVIQFILFSDFSSSKMFIFKFKLFLFLFQLTKTFSFSNNNYCPVSFLHNKTHIWLHRDFIGNCI